MPHIRLVAVSALPLRERMKKERPQFGPRPSDR
jgi:hypothetical protein